MVFLVAHLLTKEQFVVKVYTLNERNDFLGEVQRNKLLHDSPKIVKMTHFVEANNNMPIFEYLGNRVDKYSYIVLPLC